MYIEPIQKRAHGYHVPTTKTGKLLAIISIAVVVPLYLIIDFLRKRERSRRIYRQNVIQLSAPPAGGPIQQVMQPMGQSYPPGTYVQPPTFFGGVPGGRPIGVANQTPAATAVPEPAAPFPPDRNEYTDPSTDPPPLYTSRKGTMLDLDGSSPSSPSPAHLR